jgi:RNA polymerase sigma-70 factor (ECF subfamily)
MRSRTLEFHRTQRPSADVSSIDLEKQLERVLAEHGPALARLCVGYELNAEHRRDLLQEIHIAVWRSLAIFDGRCSLRTWVYRVAHNTGVKHVMRAKRHAFGSLKSLEEINEPEGFTDVEGEVHRENALRRLALLISDLKPVDRQVILLYIDDVGAHEIAEITGLSPPAVGVRVHRIKQLLRKIF